MSAVAQRAKEEALSARAILRSDFSRFISGGHSVAKAVKTAPTVGGRIKLRPYSESGTYATSKIA
ncbi:MAG: hypothetical protein ACN4GF_12165 [Lentimonas sp.]